jgi:hypothetical protein
LVTGFGVPIRVAMEAIRWHGFGVPGGLSDERLEDLLGAWIRPGRAGGS